MWEQQTYAFPKSMNLKGNPTWVTESLSFNDIITVRFLNESSMLYKAVPAYKRHTISFQTFFVWPFKSVIHFWKFTTLLLWDDWRIFMISGSNQQLQQQLEYILLNPDCHSWRISKMQSDTLERYAIKLCLKLEKNAIETYGMLQTAFRPCCTNLASVFVWHKRFKEGRQSVRDDERCGRSKEVKRPELIGQRVRIRLRVTVLRC